jgi:hypothetical protein
MIAAKPMKRRMPMSVLRTSQASVVPSVMASSVKPALMIAVLTSGS